MRGHLALGGVAEHVAAEQRRRDDHRHRPHGEDPPELLQGHASVELDHLGQTQPDAHEQQQPAIDEHDRERCTSSSRACRLARRRLAEEPGAGHVELEGRIGERRAREDQRQGDEPQDGRLPEEAPALEGPGREAPEGGVAALEDLHAGLEAGGATLVGSPHGPRPRVHSTHATPPATTSDNVPLCLDGVRDAAAHAKRGGEWWAGRDLNPRRLSRLVYSQIPLSTRALTRESLPSPRALSQTARRSTIGPCQVLTSLRGRPPRGAQRGRSGQPRGRHPLRLQGHQPPHRVLRQGATLSASTEDRLRALYQLLEEKMVKRSVSLKSLDPGKIEEASQRSARQKVALKAGHQPGRRQEDQQAGQGDGREEPQLVDPGRPGARDRQAARRPPEGDRPVQGGRPRRCPCSSRTSATSGR